LPDYLTFKVGKGEIVVVPVVRGLVSEGGKVRSSIEAHAPDVLAMSISPEELTALKGHDGKDAEPMSGSVEENVYEDRLSQFGDVARPPRCFTVALELAREKGLEVKGVDLSEADFTRAYVHLVTGWDFIRRTFGRGRFARTRFDMSSPEAFVLDWDRRLRRAKGYDALEKRREAEIAKGLRGLAERKGKILAFIEVERADGVAERLQSASQEKTG
jgi:hypothetical protein